MAPRRKPPETPDLLAQPASVPAPAAPQEEVKAPPAMLDYTPLTSGVVWRVERFAEFAAEFMDGGKWTDQMARFHFMAQDFTRQWLIVRRLFGIGPVVPGPDAHPDDLRSHTREEVKAAFGFDEKGLHAELDSVRGLWRSDLDKVAREEPLPTVAEPAKELKLDDTLLARHGFSEKMFKVVGYDPQKRQDAPRDETENRVERDWFATRVAEWDKMLSDSLAGPVAREALLSSLYLRRISAEMSVVSPTQSKYRELHTLKKQTEEQYQVSLDKLQAMFPEMAIAGKVSFRAQVSDLVAGQQAYYGFGDTRLVDKMHTVAELEWLNRRSQQVGIRYRFGLALAVAEARAGLYDPDFRSQFKTSYLKAADEGFRLGAQAALEAMRVPVVDLEKGVAPGEGDDFEDYKEVRSQKSEGSNQ